MCRGGRVLYIEVLLGLLKLRFGHRSLTVLLLFSSSSSKVSATWHKSCWRCRRVSWVTSLIRWGNSVISWRDRLSLVRIVERDGLGNRHGDGSRSGE